MQYTVSDQDAYLN